MVEVAEHLEQPRALSKLQMAIVRKLESEHCTILGTGRKELAGAYIEVVKKVASALDATPIGIGSTFNCLGENIEPNEAKDIDFALLPRGDMNKTQRKLTRYLKGLTQMEKRKNDVDVEAGRQYTAYDVYDKGRIALVVSIDKKGKPTLGSLRLVDMNSKAPWKSEKTEGNPTTKNAVVDLGLPPLDTNLGIWLDPRIYDPTQNYAGVLSDDLTIVKCDHTQIDEVFPKLTQKSQAVLSIRHFAQSGKLPEGINIDDYRMVAPNLYVFRYNLEPLLRKMPTGRIVEALTNKDFVEKVIKFTFPYIYSVIDKLNNTTDNLKSLLDEVVSEEKYLNIVALLSLAYQKSIYSGDLKSGPLRDEASIAGRRIEKEMFDYYKNIEAFEAIKNQGI